MPLKNSQPFIWLGTILLTATLYAAALSWFELTIELPEPQKKAPIRLDLSILIAEPTPTKAEPAPQPDPTTPPPEPPPEPVVEPEPTPPPTPPVAEPPPPPPPVKPPPPPKPKPDPTLLKKKQAEEKAAREKKQRLQRERAKKRAAEKRRRVVAAKKEAARRAAAAKKARDAKRVARKPGKISGRAPAYPRSARRAGHQGTVTVRFTVNTSGKVSSVRITRSSGHSSLDQAAVNAVRKWRFTPARNGLGQAISHTYSQTIPFRLR